MNDGALAGEWFRRSRAGYIGAEMSSELPRAIGRYEVTGCVSPPAGDAGGVYYGRYGGVTYVVHRVARPETAATAELERFTRLSRDAGGLARLVDVVDDGPNLGLVLEPVDGVTLARLMSHMRVSEERFPDAATWYVVHQLAQTLARCHSARSADGKPASFFHGRIAAENILISWEGRVVVMGLCPLVRGVEYPGERPSRASSSWFAPEFHQAGNLSSRSDSYGVTLLLRALLTGEDRPAPGASATPLDALRPDLPAELGRALDRGMIALSATRASCAELARWISTMAREDAGCEALRETVAPFESLGALWSNRSTSKLPPSDDVGRSQLPDSATRKAAGGQGPKLASAKEAPRVDDLASLSDISEEESATMIHDEVTGAPSSTRSGESEPVEPDFDFEGTLVIERPAEFVGVPNKIQAARATLMSASHPLVRTVVGDDDDDPLPLPRPPVGATQKVAPIPPTPPTPPTPPAPPPKKLLPGQGTDLTVKSAVEARASTVAPETTPVVEPAASPDPTAPATKRRSGLPWLVAFGIVFGVAAGFVFVVARGGALPPWLARAAAFVESPKPVAVESMTTVNSEDAPPSSSAPSASATAAAEPAPSASATAVAELAPSASAVAEPAPSASAMPSAAPAITDVATRKPLSFEAYLTVKSSVDAPVYVQGVLVGRTNQRTLSRCRWRNVRLGVLPGPFWVSALKVEYLPCLGAHELTLEPDPALVAAEQQRKR